MKLAIIRHGQTEENLKRIVQGHIPGKLTSKGLGQANKLANILKNEHFDIIYSSDLKRCVDTTQEIIKFHKNTPVHFTASLRETSFGNIQGMKATDVDWKRYKGSFLSKKPGSGESILDMQKRVSAFIREVSGKHRNQSVLVITHGGPMRVFRSFFEDASLEDLFNIEIENCEVWRFDVA